MDSGLSPVCPDDLGGLAPAGNCLRCSICARQFHWDSTLLDLLPIQILNADSTETHQLTAYNATFSRREDRRWQQPIRVALEKLGNGYLYSWAAHCLHRAAPPTPQLLDAACGDGILRDYLPSLPAYTGVDFSSRLLHRALRFRPAAYYRADLRHLPFTGASFDAVVCLQALQYMDRVEPVLAEFARVLKPGGLLVFSVPNARSLKYRLRGTPSIQLQHFTRENLVALLSPQFEIEELTSRGLWIPTPKISLHLPAALPEPLALSFTIRARLR